MILIEMAMKRDLNDGRFPEKIRPRRDSYVWMVGRPWPVPIDEDELVMRVEAFGPEREWIEKNGIMLVQIARISPTSNAMDWLPGDAQFVSGVMRQKCQS
jgi:hypothetical protein